MKSIKTVTKWASQAVTAEAVEAFNAALLLIKEPLSLVEKAIADQSVAFDGQIRHYIDDACGGSGKRLRPALTLLAGGASGGVTQEHHRLALIFELIHIASLIHDDIMDEAALRRERPTLHATWGNSKSVLVGDLLFAHALKLSTDFSDSEISRRIADATIDVCSGEILQTERRFDVALHLEEYYRIIALKTGSLFRAGCELGAMLSKSSPPVVEALKQYGNKIGIAYQILDDCIDLIGNEKEIGKTLGTDLSHGKFTLPILLMLQSCSQKERGRWHDYLLDKKERDLQQLREALLEKKALQQAVVEARQLITEALQHLEIVPSGPYVDGLQGVASYLLGILRTIN